MYPKVRTVRDFHQPHLILVRSHTKKYVREITPEDKRVMMLSSSFLPDHILLRRVTISRYEARKDDPDRISVSGVFVIGLIVPSDAQVFVGGQTVNGVAASPFVYGQSIPHTHASLGSDIVHKPIKLPKS
jgi:hypothetical protein